MTREEFFGTDEKTALQAKEDALKIAFAPVVFQSAKVLRDTGILETIMAHEATGLTLEEVTEKVNLSTYGIRVLLESALSIGLVTVNDGKYRVTKTGYFLVEDELTKVNMDFVHDVCYQGLFHLDESIKTGKPAGLKVFGEWDTIYEGLSQLPPHVQKSWFGFDHYYSDKAFPVVLRLLMNNGIKNMLDIGGNTGKWAIACAKFDPNVHITIMDLPGQLDMAKKTVKDNSLEERISFHPINMLDESQDFPTGHDAIWMSQFLDCFSESQIISILSRCHKALTDDGHVFILEGFWDRQKYKTASFCLHHTSLYFTALANGNSQMYDSRVFNACVTKAGFEIVQEINDIGLSHTLLKCKKSTINQN